MADDQVEIGAALGALAIEGEEEEAPDGGGERAIRAVDDGHEWRGRREQPQLFATHAPHRADAVASGDPSGTIRLDINQDGFFHPFFPGERLLDLKKYSSTIEVGGMPWRIVVTAKGVPQLDFARIRCDLSSPNRKDYKVLSVAVRAEFKLINHDDDTNTIITWTRGTISHGSMKMKVWQNLEWSAFLRDRQGFVKDDKITVQVEFWLSNIVEIRRPVPELDFTDPNDPYHDIVFLTDDGRKVYAGKERLCRCSSYFHSMFYGPFVERNMKIVPLGGIDCEEFVELLKMIYSPRKKITDKNFKYLLKLGQFFDMIEVMEKVEKYLIKCDDDEEKEEDDEDEEDEEVEEDDEDEDEEEASETKLDEAEKLLLADRYNLIKLKDRCLQRLSYTTRELLKDSPEFVHLSKDLKDVLMERRQAPYGHHQTIYYL